MFRIFHRWQAVNQQWKVLNYDKSKDSEDGKAGEKEWTLSLLHQRVEAGPDASPSTSSLVAAIEAAVTPTVETVAMVAVAGTGTAGGAGTATGGGGGPDSQNSVSQSNGTSETAPYQHYAYNFLQLFSHLRPQEPRGAPQPSPSTSSRELVMRVTTV